MLKVKKKKKSLLIIRLEPDFIDTVLCFVSALILRYFFLRPTVHHNIYTCFTQNEIQIPAYYADFRKPKSNCMQLFHNFLNH